MTSHTKTVLGVWVAVALGCALSACAGAPGLRGARPLEARNGGGLARGWTVKLSGPPGITRRIALHGPALVLMAQTPNGQPPARQLFGFDRTSGALLWSHEHPLSERFGRDRLLGAPGRVIYFSNTGVFALDSATGALRWTFDPGGRELTEALRVGELLVLAAGDTLVVLDAETGRWVRGISAVEDDSREPGLVLEGVFEGAQGPHALISQRLVPSDALPAPPMLPPQVAVPGRSIVLRAVALLGEGGERPEPPFAQARVAWQQPTPRQRCDTLAFDGALVVSCDRRRAALYDPDAGQLLAYVALTSGRADARTSSNGLRLLPQGDAREPWERFAFDKQPGPWLLDYSTQRGLFMDTLCVRAQRPRDGAPVWERCVPARADAPTRVLRPEGLGALLFAFERLLVVLDEDTGALLGSSALDTRGRGEGWFAAEADAQALYVLQRRGPTVTLSAAPLRRASPDDDAEPDPDDAPE